MKLTIKLALVWALAFGVFALGYPFFKPYCLERNPTEPMLSIIKAWFILYPLIAFAGGVWTGRKDRFS